MADPFSVFTGALTVADVSLRVIDYLRSVSKVARHVDKEIDSLEREVINFNNVFAALGQLCATANTSQNEVPPKSLQHNDPTIALWSRAAQLVQEGEKLVEGLQDLLFAVLGKEHSERWRKYDDIRKAIKLLSKNEQYIQHRQRLVALNLELNTMLTAISLSSNALFHSTTHESLEQLPGKLSQELQDLGVQLRTQIKALEDSDNTVEPSISSAKAAAKYASLNEHFYVQNPDISIWTGRRKGLDHLKDALMSSNSLLEPRTQKRFVVHGIAGAGKTQFCCKFAQDFRDSFWGIFWIDASSFENATESWRKIAKIGQRDPNEEAGKHWLSNLQAPWLLIIDSADYHYTEDSIQCNFPRGDRGCILITTRNPRLGITATVGHLSLDRLEETEANELLRKATKHLPWDTSAMSSASQIAKHLDYLPLALIHAGRAIFHRLCTLKGYIPFFNRTLDDIRIRRPSLSMIDDDDTGLGAFTSFDIIYSGLETQAYRKDPRARVCKDALELINIFSFLQSSDLGLETLSRAATTLQISQEEDGNSRLQGETSPSKAARPLSEQVKMIFISLAGKFQNQTPVLPHLLRNTSDMWFDESRARKAMDTLVKMSMVFESSEVDSYSMHPLVHVWVRKRLSIAEQALWCEMAANVLARSVKLPPLVDGPQDQDYYLRILPHVVQVRSVQTEIQNYIHQRRKETLSYGWRMWLFFSQPSQFTALDAGNLARYSRVYMECGKFQEAEDSLRPVRNFLSQRLGNGHTLSLRAQLALSGALWHLGRLEEAQDMQEDALRICRSSMGNTHPQTLRILDALGETSWQRGRLTEARGYLEEAIQGMERDPNMVRDHLKATDHLGRVYGRYFDLEKARELHENAANGLTEAFGAHDSDAMIAADNLAMVLLLISGEPHVIRAHDLMYDVYHARREKLGKEHVYTLWAACNFARTLAAKGSMTCDQAMIREALTLFTDGIDVATRNLGADHVGTLMGRTHHAHALALDKQYDSAEAEFKDTMERQKSISGARNGTHVDRLATIKMLIECYESQERFEEAGALCETMVSEFDALGGHLHPLREQMVLKAQKFRTHG